MLPHLGFKAEPIVEIRNALKTYQDVPKLSDEQIALFASSCDGDVSATLHTIREYHAVKRAAPAVFDDRTLRRPEVRHHVDNVTYFAVLPELSPCGRVVLFSKLRRIPPVQFDLGVWTKVLSMVLDLVVFDGPIKGLIILYDMDECRMGYFMRLRVGLLRTLARYLQEALPLKLHQVHVLNTHPLVDKIVSIARPFVKAELYQKHIYHKKNADMEKFFDAVLPRRCMPSDYGGTLPNLRELHERTVARLKRLEDYFEEDERQRGEHKKKHLAAMTQYTLSIVLQNYNCGQSQLNFNIVFLKFKPRTPVTC